ncbi:MAG TPA: nucleotide-binding protein [Methanospirillum sp.]|nr:nucleotide-binding protein [Methanospirillum sp.]
MLDTSAFFLSIPLPGRLSTVHRVEDELKDLRGRARFSVLLSEGMSVCDPSPEACKTVRAASISSGDASVLSATDIDVLALAQDINGTIVTDDFAIQNTAKVLGINIHSIIQRGAIQRQWKIRCLGCGKYFEEMTRAGDCPICGSALKRKLK